MTDLEYSMWHRSLGYSYFAMDVDFVEIRNDVPVAIIEASLCTPSFATCDGPSGVFNRFLRETKGFQLELAWWVAKWLEVPAYVVCMGESDQLIHVLSLVNGEQTEMSKKDYLSFIEDISLKINSTEKFLNWNPLNLRDLLDKLISIYPGIRNYPYFNDKTKWMKDYEQRINEIKDRIPRKPSVAVTPARYPVKGETTGERPKDYERLRNQSAQNFLNIPWVEWRKDFQGQMIGRPAAILKTIPLDASIFSIEEATTIFMNFCKGQEAKWLIGSAKRLLVPFYFVIFELSPTNAIGNKFLVWNVTDQQNYQPNNLIESDYAKWICSL